jgi:hypothetical protein
LQVFSQTVKVSGQLSDAKDNSPLIGAIVVLINQADTTKQTGVSVDIDGKFEFSTYAGVYKLRAELITYNYIMQ